MAHPAVTQSKGIRESFNENGFYIARGLIDEDVTSRVLDDVHLSFRQQLELCRLPIDPGSNNTALRRNMATLLEHDKDLYIGVLRLASRLLSVHNLMLDRRIQELLPKLGWSGALSLPAGVAAHIVSNELRIPGGYMGWPPHQDWTGSQGSLKQMVVWAALVDIDVDFYPLNVIPGSHRKGLWRCDRSKRLTRGALIEIDPALIDAGEWVPVQMARGDVAFMSGFTVHKTGEGARSGVRIACGTRYEDITEKSFVERGYPCAFGGHTATQEELHPGRPTAGEVEALFT